MHPRKIYIGSLVFSFSRQFHLGRHCCTMSSYLASGKSLRNHPSYVNLPWVQDHFKKEDTLLFPTIQCIYIKIFQKIINTLLPTRKGRQNIFREGNREGSRIFGNEMKILNKYNANFTCAKNPVATYVLTLMFKY